MLGRFGMFLWQRKKYWLVPLVLVLVVFGALLAVAQRQSMGPFRYNF